jgi:hypothetical protein
MKYMKHTRKLVLTSALCTVLTALLFAAAAGAATVTTTGSGNWDSTTPNAPWPGGTPPQPTDDAVISSGNTVTVDVPETVGSLQVNGVCNNNSVLSVETSSNTNTTGAIFGSGTFTQGVDAVLNVAGGTVNYSPPGSIATLNATAPGNSVNYTGNPFLAKRQSYFDLTFSGTGNWYNGSVPIDPGGPVTIGGTLNLTGKGLVQLGNNMTINGDLNIGSNFTYDPSCFYMTVVSNTYVGGTLIDLCGDNTILENVMSNVTVLPGGTFALGDSVQWSISGNLTNNGTMTGVNYGAITFVGPADILTGSTGVNMPQMIVNGTAIVNTTVTVTTNLALNGTLGFYLNSMTTSNVLVDENGPLEVEGNLVVTNVGPPLADGETFLLLNVPAGIFGMWTSEALPAVGYGLSVVDNTANSDGTLSIVSVVPTIALAQSGNSLTLSWDSSTYPGYFVQAQTNKTGISTNWYDAGSGGVSPFTIQINKTNPPTFLRLINTSSD